MDLAGRGYWFRLRGAGKRKTATKKDLVGFADAPQMGIGVMCIGMGVFGVRLQKNGG